MFNDLLLLWSSQPGVSLAIWLVVLITVLYLGRVPAHQLILTTGRSIYRFMRTASRAVANIEREAITRNKEIILAHGREATERMIEREFTRINEIVARDLSHYPALHRELSDAVERLENDYQAATDAPPLPPEWLNVVQTISELPKQSDPMVVTILESIKDEVTEAHDKTLKAYQKTSAERHRLLSALQPQWRALATKLGKTKEVVAITQERADAVDKHMATYEAIRDSEDPIARSLTASSLTQFFIAGLVLVVAVMGGLINFQLIAMPMSEMVGGSNYVGSVKTSDIAALVIILVEIAMGLFLLESLRITRLFPVIGHMDDKMRRRMMVITFTILFVLASIEASLAYMRDLLALDREALKQSLVGVATTNAEFRWIPSVGQMIMGFILPFALAFVAIPLESFIHATRTVLGVITVALLRTVIISLRIVGGVANQLSKILVHGYDVVITVPLTIESWAKKGINARKGHTATVAIEPELNELEETGESAKPRRSRAKRKASDDGDLVLADN
ncbi:hypothetical protein [Halioxenophilus sp. WMMB6]|uniref:hypothetical protein n=1 Tax=Halioxenophilus sp. WMMB6 TaxID=3073815 RepID=UPI00295EA4C5|nr:hypothetical protein [Halioxenophilus sp. WMMB6]